MISPKYYRFSKCIKSLKVTMLCLLSFINKNSKNPPLERTIAAAQNKKKLSINIYLIIFAIFCKLYPKRYLTTEAVSNKI